MRMTAGMRQNFANVGLPYAFTDQGVVANTMDAHRVLAWCGSPEAQEVGHRMMKNCPPSSFLPSIVAVSYTHLTLPTKA